MALLAGLTLLIFHEPIFLRLADWALKIGHKLHLIRDIESRKQKYAELRDDYQQCSGALRRQWKLILLSFVFNLAQRLAIVLSPVCVYLAEGGNRARIGEAFAAQTMVILGSNAVPLPGSVGVADYLFLDGYRVACAVSGIAGAAVPRDFLLQLRRFVRGAAACLRRQTKVKQGTVKRMLGFYNYTVWLTYGSLVSAVIGIFVSLAGHGHPYIGAIFLLISGLCDAFDGMIARTKTDRTEQEKQYGHPDRLAQRSGGLRRAARLHRRRAVQGLDDLRSPAGSLPGGAGALSRVCGHLRHLCAGGADPPGLL